MEVNEIKRNRTFVVLGMHRSATSLVAKALHDQGIEMGTGTATAIDRGSHFEDLSFVDINDSLLEKAGGSWDKPPAKEKLDKVQDGRCGRLVDYRQTKNEMWGWKDPRTALVFDKYLPHLGGDVYLVCVFRKPRYVAKSLKRLWGFGEKRCRAIIDRYNKDIIDSIHKFLWW